MKYISEIFINNGSKITVNSLSDLQRLPDKSIFVLFNNSNYIEVIYLYVLCKLDMYLEENSYTNEKREKYFDACSSVIPMLVCCQNNFLAGGQLCLNGVFNTVPKEIEVYHKKSLKIIISFFSGILSTTPCLNNELFSKEKLLFIKHNYCSVLSALDAEIIDF